MWFRSPRVRIIAALGATALAAAVLGLVAVFSGGGGEGIQGIAERTPVADVELALGDVTVASAGPDIEMPPQIIDRIESSVIAYVERASLIPLQTGEAADLEDLFTPFAAVSADGPDRDSLVDEALGTVSADITASTAAFSLNGLADRSGNVVLVAASLVLDLETATEDGPLEILRLGDLVFVPDGFDWKISSYDMRVRREGGTRGDRGDAGASQDQEVGP